MCSRTNFVGPLDSRGVRFVIGEILLLGTALASGIFRTKLLETRIERKHFEFNFLVPNFTGKHVCVSVC